MKNFPYTFPAKSCLTACLGALLLSSCSWGGEELAPERVSRATALQGGTGDVGAGGILADDEEIYTTVLAQETEDRIDPDLPTSAPLTPQGATVYFSYDSAHIDERAVPRILQIGETLLGDHGLRARLEGHTDERGTRSYNLALGERRGQSVRAMLMQQGVQRHRLEVLSYGEESPMAEGAGESVWKQNRRVEIRLTR